MTKLNKSTREIYRDIRSELIGVHYRLLLIRQLFTSEDTNNLLNKTALRFFTILKWDLFNTITIAISRLTDPPKSFNKYQNASLEQIINNLDSRAYSKLSQSLSKILLQIRSKSSRIGNWRKKWAGHRDFDVVQGSAPKPAISLPEINEVLVLIGKFLNEFEEVFQDPKIEINFYENPNAAKELEETERLKIFPPNRYEEMHFLGDDGDTIIEIIKKSILSD